MSSLEINGSILYYDNNPAYYIRDYYYYVYDLVKEIMINTSANFKNTIKIHINYEHTLVVPGGRDTNNSPIGSIPILNIPSMNYLVRITDLDKLVKSDIIIDYSIPNSTLMYRIQSTLQMYVFTRINKINMTTPPRNKYGFS